MRSRALDAACSPPAAFGTVVRHRATRITSDLFCRASFAGRISGSAFLSRWARKSFLVLALLFFVSCPLGASGTPPPEAWVPIRWTGGPLEIAWRTQAKTLPADPTVRDALARWYAPSTLALLDDSSANCLLVTWGASADAAIQTEQQRLVQRYAEAAHKRGLVVLGIVYAAGDASAIAADASRAALDGLVLEGQFAPGFSAALRKQAGSILVTEIAKDAAASHWNSAPIVAVEGIAPSAHNLSEMGIRGAPSSEPWIESNIWLVHSLTVTPPPRSLWISSQLEHASAVDYARAVADAAAAGGHWIISLDDHLRAGLRAGDASALDTWHRLSSYLKFAERRSQARSLGPYGNVGIVLDPAAANEDVTDEYLKLAARRQVPYRVIARSEMNAAALANFRALVAIAVDPPSARERKLLQDFAENGGLVIAGAGWGGAPKTERFSEVQTGKGRVAIYTDPDPETVARDLKELLSDDELGMVPFNVPSVITFARGGGPEPLVVELVNYFDHPVEAITLRVAGKFRSARMETPEEPALDLPLREAEGRTEVTIPNLLVWSVVSIQ